MAANSSLRPPTYEPTNLNLYDASLIVVKTGGKYTNIKGCPGIMLKGNIKFLSTSESGKLKIGMAVAKEDAQSLSTFAETHIKPALAKALTIPAPDAYTLGKRPSPKKQKLALELLFSTSEDKFDSTKAIVNFYCNSITQFFKVDIEAQTAASTEGVTQNANAEVTCWLGLSKSAKDEGVYYLNIQPKQIVYEELVSEPKEERKREPPAITFGGMPLAS